MIVIAGEVVLREEEGETILRDGDCAVFKSGVANGHAFENRSDGLVILFRLAPVPKMKQCIIQMWICAMIKRGTSRTFLHKDGTPFLE